MRNSRSKRINLAKVRTKDSWVRVLLRTATNEWAQIIELRIEFDDVLKCACKYAKPLRVSHLNEAHFLAHNEFLFGAWFYRKKRVRCIFTDSFPTCVVNNYVKSNCWYFLWVHVIYGILSTTNGKKFLFSSFAPIIVAVDFKSGIVLKLKIITLVQ